MVWYVEGIHELCHMTVVINDMVWYVHEESCYIWKHGNVMIWHMYVIWMIWYDWHEKRRTSMKYNPGIHIKINDIIKDMRNDIKK